MLFSVKADRWGTMWFSISRGQVKSRGPRYGWESTCSPCCFFFSSGWSPKLARKDLAFSRFLLLQHLGAGSCFGLSTIQAWLTPHFGELALKGRFCFTLSLATFSRE